MAALLQDEWQTLFHDINPYAELRMAEADLLPPAYNHHPNFPTRMGPSVFQRQKIVLKKEGRYENEEVHMDLSAHPALHNKLLPTRSWAIVALYSPDFFMFEIGSALVHDSDKDGRVYHNPVFPALAEMNVFRISGVNLQALLVETIIPPRWRAEDFLYWQTTPLVQGTALQYARINGYGISVVCHDVVQPTASPVMAKYSLPPTGPAHDLFANYIDSVSTVEEENSPSSPSSPSSPPLPPCLCTLQ